MEVVRAGHTPELVTLLYKLNLAVALPPDAIMAPPSPDRPAILPEARPIVGADAVGAIVRRPTASAGSGRVFLREVDRRLDGLVVRLDTFRLGGSPAALLSIGVVSADPASSSWPWATTRDLWALAKAALVTHDVPCERLPGLGDEALLALHGEQTAQVAWLVGDRLATVSVTSLSGDRTWITTTARSIAECADALLSGRVRRPVMPASAWIGG